VIAIVDVWGHYFFVIVVTLGNVEGVKAKGCGVVGEIWESRVVVVFDLWFSMIVYGFFYHLNTCGCASETLEHGYKTRVGCLPNGVGGGDHERRWGSNRDG